MQALEVFVGTAQRRQADGFGFEDVPHFARLLETAARQGLYGLQGVDRGPQVTAVTLANLDQPAEGQNAHGFTHGIAADTQFAGQLWLSGQALAHGPGAAGDALAQLLDGLFDQGALDQ
ncbi:hypothetical protein D3C72_2184560 [compost metagenome]